MNGKVIVSLVLGVALLAVVAAIAVYAYNSVMPPAPQTVYLDIENVYGYNLGVPEGLAGSGQQPAQQPGSYAYPGRPFHGPFGFGFGGFGCIFPLLFFGLIFMLLRGLWWHRHWHGGWHRGPWEKGVPPSFEEWHRQAHKSDSAEA